MITNKNYGFLNIISSKTVTVNEGLKLDIKTVKIEPPKDCNTILGMAHFIKTAEDLYEALVNSVPNIQVWIGFL